MANIFEGGPDSPMLKGEAGSEKEAELLDKKQELMQVAEGIKGALKEVEEAEARLKSAKANLNDLRRRDDQLSEDIGELEKEMPGNAGMPEIQNPLSDHPSEVVRKMGEENY